MIKAIFFDNGNVLMKEGYRPGIKEYEQKHNIEEGLLYVSAHDRPFWKEFTKGNITEKQYLEDTKEDFKGELNVTELMDIINRKSLPNTELLAYLPELKQRFTLGVISNNPKEWFDYYEQEFGFGNTFSVKAVSGYVHMRKPGQEIFKWALAQAKVTGPESIYIDDRPDRVGGAESLGMKVIIYKDLPQLRNDIAALTNN